MNIKERFKLTLDIVRANKELQHTMMWSFREYEGIPVFISDVAVLAKFGCRADVPNAFATLLNTFKGPTPAIVINTAMTEFEHFEAILAHEAGHLNLGHIDSLNKSWKRFIPNYRSEQYEFEADDYAKEKGFDMVVALTALRDAVPFPASKKELDKRIARIK